MIHPRQIDGYTPQGLPYRVVRQPSIGTLLDRFFASHGEPSPSSDIRTRGTLERRNVRGARLPR